MLGRTGLRRIGMLRAEDYLPHEARAGVSEVRLSDVNMQVVERSLSLQHDS